MKVGFFMPATLVPSTFCSLRSGFLNSTSEAVSITIKSLFFRMLSNIFRLLPSVFSERALPNSVLSMVKTIWS